jgi:hypothetical protein
LKAIAKRPVPDISKRLVELVEEISSIEKNRNADVAAVVAKMSQGISEIKELLKNKPKSFAIERNNLGFIERIVPEY